MRCLYPRCHDRVDPVAAYGRLGWHPSGRPAVRLNMISSVDGAAVLAGRSGPLGGAADRNLFATLRSLASVILVGAGTMRVEGYGPVRLGEVARARRVGDGMAPVPPIAVVTRSCQLPWGAPFFTEAESRPVVVTAAGAPQENLDRAASVADVIVAGELEVDLPRAVQALGQRGYSDVLAEGGPRIAAQLSAALLVDELCLTLSPMLIGGDARRILNGPNLSPLTTLALDLVLEADEYLFLRYRRR
jgi:riboflavin biosynthesis pyrimidine reductase